MYSFCVLVLFGSLAIAFGSNCQDLSGLWSNQLGSNMTIIHRTGNTITGEYSTAVESRLNAAAVATNITGTFHPVDEGAIISFTVLFNRGKSLTTWVGQCMVCDGEEVLFTSWVLRSYTQKRMDRWMAIRTNQDTFRRIPGDENVPHHLRIQGPLREDVASPTCMKNIKAGTRGAWIASTGDELDFEQCTESGVFSGVNQNASVIGRSHGEEPFTALGFLSAAGDTVKGWAGHIYEESRERKLETAWLSHTFSNNCKDPRSFLKYGMTNYTFEVESPLNSIWESIVSLG